MRGRPLLLLLLLLLLGHDSILSRLGATTTAARPVLVLNDVLLQACTTLFLAPVLFLHISCCLLLPQGRQLPCPLLLLAKSRTLAFLLLLTAMRVVSCSLVVTETMTTMAAACWLLLDHRDGNDNNACSLVVRTTTTTMAAASVDVGLLALACLS